jgi:hypothetical protein
MSSVGGAATGGARAPEKRKRGRPLGISKKAREEVEVTPPVPRRHGRPPGSKNKKTLAAIVAAAAASSYSAVAAVGSCNGPGKSNIRIVCSLFFIFCVILTSCIIMHISPCMFLLNLKLFGLKSIFIIWLVRFYKDLHSLFLF